jgi:hypothetical protein
MKNQNTILKIVAITSIISASNLAFSNEHAHHEHSMEMNHNKIDHSKMNHEKHNEDENSIFVCPMHPEIMSDKAGTCPICKMALEKTSFDEE